MVVCNDVEFFNVNELVEKLVEYVCWIKYIWYLICDGMMDEVFGVIYIKDFVGVCFDEFFDWKLIMWLFKKVLEMMLISKLL